MTAMKHGLPLHRQRDLSRGHAEHVEEPELPHALDHGEADAFATPSSATTMLKPTSAWTSAIGPSAFTACATRVRRWVEHRHPGKAVDSHIDLTAKHGEVAAAAFP